MAHLTSQGRVLVLHLDDSAEIDGDNRFTPDYLATMHGLFDRIEAATGPAALVTTGRGKFFSNGFEPERFSQAGREDYVLAGQRWFARIMTVGLPTVAAINGHAFGGGAFAALAHDIRLMRADRGFFCLPEVLLGMIIPNGMMQLAAARMPAGTAHEAMLTGRRYTGTEAKAAGIVEDTAPADQLLEKAIEIADRLAPTAGPVLAATKRQLYPGVLAALGAM